MFYPYYCEQERYLREISAKCRLKTYSIGKSVLGRDILAVDIGESHCRGLVVGGVHGTEYLSVLAALKFAGEYACHGKAMNWNHYEAALLEAAFMTGFERNADVVWMTTPAPLFAHVDGWQWRPDQIWYDNTQMFKSVSYYVQQMYATNAGTNVLKLTMGKKPVANQEGQDGLFASAAYDAKSGEVIIKIANTSKTDQLVQFNLTGMKGDRIADVLTLCHDGMDDENSIGRPELITPVKGETLIKEENRTSVLRDELPPMSFRIFRFKK